MTRSLAPPPEAASASTAFGSTNAVAWDHPDARRWRDLSDLIANHYGSNFELAARFSAIFAACIALYWLTGYIEILIWCAMYAGSVMAVWVYMRGIQPPGSPRSYRTAVALDMLQSLIFMSIVPYGALVGPPDAIVGSLATIAAFAIYNIARPTPIYVIVIWEGGLTVATTIFVSVVYLQNFGVTIGTVCAIIIVILVALYAAIICWDGLRRILSEREIERQTIAAQRIEAVGQLTAGMAHEFNNILAGIYGHLELAEIDPDEASRAESLEAARNGTMRAAEHVKQLMSFARKAPVQPIRTELRDLLQACGGLFTGLIGSARRLTIIPGNEPLFARVDPTAVKSALANLVLNARDAGANRIELSVTREVIVSPTRISQDSVLLQGSYLAITCRDDGPGMPPEIRSKATQPFFTTKPAGQGTGLGLSMVRGTAEQLGGGLRIQDAPRGGADIAILVPEDAASQGELNPLPASAVH